MSVAFKKRSKPAPANLRVEKETDTKEWIAYSSSDVVIQNEEEEKSILIKETRELKPTISSQPAAVPKVGPVVFESSREIAPTTYAGDATYSTEVDTASDR
jgi:hypothetical protein